MKLTVLDGSDVRSAFLAKFLTYNAHHTGLTEVVFLDNSTDNLAIFGEIVRYAFNTIRPGIQLSTTTDPVVALRDASYIITTPRVGGDGSRIRDERIALQHNIPGQETTGAGGLVMAIHSTPAILRYCRLVEGHAAEDAILFNLINPSGLVTEVIVKSGFKRRVYGICDTPSELIRELPVILGCEEYDLSIEHYGLDHSSWFTYLTVRGEEVVERLIASPELHRKTAMQYLSPELVRLCDNQLLNEYPHYYYYREMALRMIWEAGETHEKQVACINQEMHEALRTVDARTQPEATFAIWMQHYLCRKNSYVQSEPQQEKFHTREPLTLHQSIEEPDTSGYAGVTLGILETVNSTTTKRIVVSIQNHDAFDFLRPDDMIEASCDLSQDSLKPVTPVKVPTAQESMIFCVKEYERLAVAAILQQNKSLVVRALIAYPLIGSYSLARTLAEAYLNGEQFAVWQQPALPMGFPPLALRLAGLQTERFVFDVGQVRREPPPDKIAISPGSSDKTPTTIWELPHSRCAQRGRERSSLYFIQVGSGVSRHPVKQPHHPVARIRHQSPSGSSSARAAFSGATSGAACI